MLDLATDGRVATLAMRHGKVNAIDLEFCNELLETFEQLAGDSNVDGVLLKGQDRVFSAGIDLKRWLAEDESYVRPFLEKLDLLFRRVFEFPKPIVAVISGHAVAGGCMLAAACDYRVIAPEASIGIPELRIGVPLPMMAIEIMRFIARPQSFQDVVNRGAMFAGTDAVRAGLASEVAGRDIMEQRAMEVLGELIHVPAATYEFTKQQCRSVALQNARDNWQRLGDRFWQIWLAPQTRSAIDDYVRERLS